MSTFVAIVLGTVLGGEMFEIWQGEPWRTSGVLVAIAAAGTLTSLWIPETRPAKDGSAFLDQPGQRNLAGVSSPVARPHALHDRRRHLVLLVPRRIDPAPRCLRSAWKNWASAKRPPRAC